MVKGIRIACINHEVTIKDAAFRAGLSHETIYRFMRGDNSTLLSTLDQFCTKGLWVSFGDVFDLGRK